MTELHSDLIGISGDLMNLLPELVLVATIILLLLSDLTLNAHRRLFPIICFIGISISLFYSLDQFLTFDSITDAFNGMISLTDLTAFWKMLIGASSLLIVIMSSFRSDKFYASEYYMLMIGILLGAHLLIMSSNLLMLYFSLEVISLCSYILTFFSFNRESSESSLKYLLFGATSSAIMLYGMSLLFAISGTLDFTGQTFIDTMLDADAIPVVVASILTLSGMLFKISAVPFHIWTPDVYSTAPTPVVAYFSVVPKMAGLAILIKFLLAINLFGQSPINFSTLLASLAILTITVGNFSALWQNNAKRLMAYSAIAQTGFLLVGLAAFSETSLVNVLFYSCVYVLGSIGAFLIIHYFERKKGIVEIIDYSGLINSYPFICILFLALMLSLTGLPPFGGFTAKFLIFSSLWESYNYSNNNWLLILLIFGLVNTVISLFYYLKIPYYMIFKKAEKSSGRPKVYLDFENYLGALLVVSILLIFFRPDWLMSLINNISFVF